MNHPTREQERLIVKQWVAAGPALKRQRDEELRSRPYDWMAVDALLDMGARFGRPRFAEGLVEMQRLFRRTASGTSSDA
jgi:hypothetical protein